MTVGEEVRSSLDHWSVGEWRQAFWHATAALEQTGPAVVNAIVKLGGTISGEHGIGWIQRGLLGLQLSPANLALQRGIKASFDPHGILNPDKVLPPG